MHADIERHIQKAEQVIQNRHNDRAAAYTKKSSHETGRNPADKQERDQRNEFRNRDAKHAQAACAIDGSRMNARASCTTSAVAPGFTASVARCRRQARAPGCPPNRPSM